MPIDTFLILGSAHSGRRALCADVCENALAPDKAAVFVSENEPADEADAKLESLANAAVYRYHQASEFSKIVCGEGFDAQACLFIADSGANLADAVEGFKALCDAGTARLVRVWSVIDCALLEAHGKQLKVYFDALSHFADCVILTNRSNIPNSLIKSLTDGYKKECKPHLVELMDKFGRLKNPLELTIDQARRISMLFDDFDPIDELELDEDNLPEEPFSLERKPDPYMERLPGGHRKNPIPEPPVNK